MRTVIALALLASLAAAQQAGSAALPPAVHIQTRVLELKDLPPINVAVAAMSTAISADGRIVAISVASLTGASSDPSSTWVHDAEKIETRELSLHVDGKPWKLLGKSGLSADGRFLAVSCAPDRGPPPKFEPGKPMPAFVPPAPVIAVFDLAAGTTELVNLRDHGCEAPLCADRPTISRGGELLAIPTIPSFGDQIPHGWTMLWNRADDSLRPLTLDENYYSLLAPQLSADGEWLVADSYGSDKSKPSGTFRISVKTGQQDFVSVGDAGAPLIEFMRDHAVDGSGQIVAFTARAPGDVPAGKAPITDIYVRNISAATTVCATRSPGGRPGDGASSDCALSADGRHVAFVSSATNLVVPPDDAAPDLFVRDLASGRTVRVPPGDDAGVKRKIFLPALSGDGRRAVFVLGHEDGVRQVVIADIDWGVAGTAPGR